MSRLQKLLGVGKGYLERLPPVDVHKLLRIVLMNLPYIVIFYVGMTSQFVIDLLMHSRHLHDLNRLAAWSEVRWFVLFLQNSSVYERVFVYLREI